MQPKLKNLVGVYQCVSAVPSVFNVAVPSGYERYTEWLRVLEYPANLGARPLFPAWPLIPAWVRGLMSPPSVGCS